MKTLLQKEGFKAFLFALIYGVCFYMFQLFLFQRDMVKTLPYVGNLNIYDAGWYKMIAQNGYEFKNNGASNSGFYILFPMVWKLTDTSEHGIAFLNIVLLSIGFAFFCRMFSLSQKDKFIWLTTPSLYFAFIPYSEALFVMLMMLSLWVIYKRRIYLGWLLLFLVSLVRPVSMILLPGFLIMQLITNPREKILRSIGHYLYKFALPLIAGQAFFIWYQHAKTGVWFAYIIMQQKNWGHVFAWPTLPFNSMYGMKLLWLNALAMFLGFFSLLLLIVAGVKWLFKNIVAQDWLLIISCLYLTAVFFITILFNPLWGINTTNVYDIHRYAFVSPFFWIFLYKYTVARTYAIKDYVGILLLTNAFWLLFASYASWSYTLYFNGSTLLILLYMAYSNKKAEWAAMAIAAINVFIQVCMMQFFMDSVYPG